jgi:hypothetical protein
VNELERVEEAKRRRAAAASSKAIIEPGARALLLAKMRA